MAWGWRYSKDCLICGKVMLNCRTDKKTCSPACRKRLSRTSSDDLSHLPILKSISVTLPSGSGEVTRPLSHLSAPKRDTNPIAQ